MLFIVPKFALWLVVRQENTRGESDRYLRNDARNCLPLNDSNSHRKAETGKMIKIAHLGPKRAAKHIEIISRARPSRSVD